MASILLTVVLLALLYAIICILKWAYHRHKALSVFRKYGIPGPKPRFLDGHMKDLKSVPVPTTMVTKWIKEYGNVFGYYLGNDGYLVINDLELLKQAMMKDFSFFPNRPKMFLDVYPMIHSVLALRDKRWKEVRSILTPTFSSSKIRLMSKIMNEKVTTTVGVVQKFSDKDKMFDMYQVVQALTLDVIAECALAMKVDCQTDPNDELLNAVQQFFLNAHNRVVELGVMFPFIKIFLTFITNFVTSGKMTNMIVKNLKEVIKKRRSNPETKRTDLLQLLLDSADSTPNTTPGKKSVAPLTDDELVGNAHISLLAGYETTGTALGYTFWLLVQHPEIQEKVYQEVLEKCPEGEVSYECIQDMHYLDQVFSESLRLYPPVVFFISRQCKEECQLGSYTIPKDMILYAPIWDIQHDPELWPNPMEFDPDRFSPENKANIQSMSFFPFGLGPRNCIGMRFAQFEAKIALAQLIRRFKFVTCEKTENPLTLICPTVIINPVNGIYLKAISRDKP